MLRISSYLQIYGLDIYDLQINYQVMNYAYSVYIRKYRLLRLLLIDSVAKELEEQNDKSITKVHDLSLVTRKL